MTDFSLTERLKVTEVNNLLLLNLIFAVYGEKHDYKKYDNR
jgi:hypothetical protein